MRRRTLLAAAAALSAAVAAPRPARALATGPTALWVLTDGGNRLAALDLLDLQERAARALPDGPWQRVLATGDGAALLVSHAGAVLRVSARAEAVLARHHGDGELTDAALDRHGRLLLLALREPGRLDLLDAKTLQLLKRWPLATVDGRMSRAGAELQDAPARRSFVVAPADLPELWEISYDPHAEDQYEGLVHDFRLGEGVPVRGYLHARRTRMPQPLHELALDRDGLLAIGAAPGQALQGYNLDARRRAGVWHIVGAPRPRAGAWLHRGDGPWLALPDAERPLVHWVHPDGRVAPAQALPASPRCLRAAAAGTSLWAALDGALLRLALDGEAAPLHVPVPGTVLDLQMLPGEREALLLTGGADAGLHRIELASGTSTLRRALSRPVAMALAGASG